MIMWQWMQLNGHFALVVTLIISTVYVQVSNGCEFASLFVSCFRGCWIAYQMFMHISCRTVFVIFPMRISAHSHLGLMLILRWKVNQTITDTKHWYASVRYNSPTSSACLDLMMKSATLCRGPTRPVSDSPTVFSLVCKSRSLYDFVL